MENKKGSGIFLGVIGVATLIVAIIGATFAFFSANAASAEDAIQATGATLKLGYSDDKGAGLKFNLIPATDKIAHYGATNAEHIASKGKCKDDVGNEICGTYKFYVGNPSFTTQQNLYGNIKITTDFVNLYFEILDETGAVVVSPMAFKDPVRNVSDVIELTELYQSLIPSKLDDADGDGKADTRDDGTTFNELDPTTYTKICTYGEMYDHDGKTETANVKCEQTNVREYTLILWIHETGSNQTDDDSSKTFAAGINFTSANDKTGVTGVIAAAEANQQGGSSSEAPAASSESGE